MFDSHSTYGQTAVSQMMTPTAGNELDGTYQTTVTIPQGAAPGTWSASVYPLEDHAGNSGDHRPPPAFPNTLAVGPLRPAPEAPSRTFAVAGDARARVSWTAPKLAVSPIFSYTVTTIPGGRSATTTTGSTAATVTGLTNGVAYTFTVTATNSDGISPASTPSAAVTPMAYVAPMSAVQQYITHVYSNLFNRAPDPAGLTGWTGKLNAGTPRVAVANAITSSTEYRSTLIAVSYRHYLGRTPDPVGLKGWLGAMGRGWTMSKMEASFIASGEYYAKAGSTDAGWVKKLYSDVLARGASPAEVASWTAQLRAGKSRSTVAMGFLLSTERLSTVVDGHYRHLLGRGIDPSGLRTWVGILQRGGRDKAIIGGIIASGEYYTRA
jgi:Domain of unknown function (DUF4214)/Fibronectin type III domain